jgi:WD40-like Beta Propeller Repeat
MKFQSNKILSIILIIAFFLGAKSRIYSQSWEEPVSITNLNSPADDYAPSYNRFDGKLYFTSERNSGNASFYIFQDSVVSKMRGNINQENENQMYVSFSSDKTAYYSAFVSNGIQYVQKIFVSKFIKNSWQKGTLVEKLDLGGFSSQPSISPNGEFIIFCASDKENIFDTDLYISYLEEDKSWGKPIGLDVLNTEDREFSPNLVSEDSLIFASDGFGGKGGLDLFLSIKKNEIWQRPEPLRSLNTEFDDTDPCLVPNGDIYFSSNRGGDKKDLNIYFAKKSSEENKTTYEEISPEIYLNTFISNIRLRKIETQKFRDFSPYFFYEKDETKINNKFTNRNKLLLTLCKDYLLATDKNLELTAWTASELELNKNSDYKNSKFTADERISRIKEKLSNSGEENRIKINYQYFDPKENPALGMVIKINPETLDFFSGANDEKFEIIPDKLEIQIQSLPEDKLDSGKIMLLSTNGEILSEVWLSKNDPPTKKILVNLSEFAKKLSNSEYLILQCHGIFGTEESKFESKLPILKSKISSRGMLAENLNGESESIKLIIIDNKTLNSENLKNYLDKYISAGNKINIYYDSNNLSNVKIIEKLINQKNKVKLIARKSKSIFPESLEIEIEIIRE